MIIKARLNLIASIFVFLLLVGCGTSHWSGTWQTEDQLVQPMTKLFLFAGQSNMVGGMIGSHLPDEYAKAPSNAVFWSGDSWIGLPDRESDNNRLGPEISFTHRLAKKFPNDTIAIVKLAVGGMSLDGPFKPGRGELYEQLIATSKRAIESLESSNESYQVAGMIWLQGEADAMFQSAAEAYEINLSQLIKLIRTEFDVPTLPVVVGKLADELIESPQWDFKYLREVQLAQEKVAGSDANVHLIRTDDIPHESDNTHFLPDGYFELGHRFAKAVIKSEAGH